MIRGPKSLSKEAAVAVPLEPDELPEVGVFEEFLQVEPFRPSDPTGHRFSPLISWLIATVRPMTTVELGPGDRASLLCTCDAVSRLGAGARCLAVRLPASSAPTGAGAPAHSFAELVAECTNRYGSLVTGYDDEAVPRVGDARIDLLHVSLLDHDDLVVGDLFQWFSELAPGATVVVTSTAADASPSYAHAKQLVSERYPSACISLGVATEALVAQVPVEGVVPVVELLRDVPAAVGSLLATFGERIEAYDHLGDEPVSPHTVRAVVAELIERQQVEREAFLSALRAYKELSARLTVDVREARSALATQAETDRLEREHLVTEFLDRLDVLTAKISTSAGKYSARLEEKDRLLADRDRLLEEREQQVLAYAGRAATAQSVIDDMTGSSSWRVTAPLRLLSRIMGRPRAQAES
jgi:hypothetical protein